MDLTDDPLAGIDASELEADIDKAIDELFVKKGNAQESAATEEETPEEPSEKPVESPAEEPVLTSTAEDPLARLKESLLTLDWEITSESIQAFETELQMVSKELSDDRHSMAVIKMASGVLQYLRATKGSAAPISVQFLHGAIRGIDIFVREPAPSDSERNEVMDKLLGQFRRLKAEIQRVKPPTTVEQPAEELVAREPEQTLEPESGDEPVLDEIAGEESILEAVSSEETVLEEDVEEEPVLGYASPPQQETQVPAEEDDEPEEFFGEESALEDVSPPEPETQVPAEEEDLAEEFIGEEPLLEDFQELEPTFAADSSEEEPMLDATSAEEQITEDLFEEGPYLEETPEEEPIYAPVDEQEDDAEEGLAEQLDLDEFLEEEPVLEQPAETEAAAPMSEVPSAKTSPPLQHLIREAHENSRQLSRALAALTQESSEFFGNILEAMAGKPSLERLEKHFGSAHRSIEGKLSRVEDLSKSLSATLTKLEKSLGQEETGGIAPNAKAELDLQVSTIRNAVRSLNEAASKLELNVAGVSAQSFNNQETPFSDAEIDTEEFTLEPHEIMESMDSEPVLDLLDEIPSESPGTSPGTPAAIYLSDVANTTLGIPTESIVNIFKVPKRRAKSFRKKGFVRLGDFKAAFGSIKRGVTGPLADMKPKELKKIQFPIIGLSPEILGSDDTEAVAPVRGIVLLSTGERHGALLTDEVMQRTPYQVKGYREAGQAGEVSGTATIEGDFEIKVLDPDYVLS